MGTVDCLQEKEGSPVESIILQQEAWRLADPGRRSSLRQAGTSRRVLCDTNGVWPFGCRPYARSAVNAARTFHGRAGSAINVTPPAIEWVASPTPGQSNP